MASAIFSERSLPYVDEVVGLFGSLRKPLLRYLLTFGMSVHDGEEIVQESFLALFKHVSCGKSGENMQAWMFRVCHNLALKHREKNRGVESLDSNEYAGPVDLSLNPEEQFLRSQRQDRLQGVLRALPELDRCCVCLRAEGLRYREIAKVLSISLGSVSISLSRSLARFERADQE